jgi:hypothetical protein
VKKAFALLLAVRAKSRGLQTTSLAVERVFLLPTVPT